MKSITVHELVNGKMTEIGAAYNPETEKIEMPEDMNWPDGLEQADAHEAPTFHNLEQDPNGIDQHQPGAKLDAGKPDMSLLQDFGKALLGVAEVGTFGANKYSRGGWQSVTEGVNRYTAAMQRHFFQERYAELDEESGLMHAKQTAWNALARLELILREQPTNGERFSCKEAAKP